VVKGQRKGREEGCADDDGEEGGFGEEEGEENEQELGGRRHSAHALTIPCPAKESEGQAIQEKQTSAAIKVEFGGDRQSRDGAKGRDAAKLQGLSGLGEGRRVLCVGLPVAPLNFRDSTSVALNRCLKTKDETHDLKFWPRKIGIGSPAKQISRC
jgi:hypothetical protein